MTQSVTHSAAQSTTPAVPGCLADSLIPAQCKIAHRPKSRRLCVVIFSEENTSTSHDAIESLLHQASVDKGSNQFLNLDPIALGVLDATLKTTNLSSDCKS
jgi:hypothetical protein